MRPVLLLVPLAITSAACTNPDRAPTAVSSGLPTAGGVLAARAKPVPNTRATFAYYTVTPSGTGGRLVGDSLAGNGLPTSSGLSIYEDGSCDVSAEIFVSGSGDATMDPTGGNTTCGKVRKLRVYFGSALGGGSPLPMAEGAFFTNVRDVYSLAVGAWGERRFRLLLRGFAGCDYLRYENVEGSDGRLGTSDDVSFGTITGRSILVTRLPDDNNGKRRWLAESQAIADGAHVGAHVAFCEKVAKPGSTYLGAYDIPFRLEVRER